MFFDIISTSEKYNLIMEGYNEMKIKRITAILLMLSMLTTTALASVLGSETYSSVKVEVAKGTTYISNVFVSNQTGVGRQSENYYIYEPNSGVVPIIANDTYIYGKTKVSQMAQKLRDDGMYPLMVMNSDFFSLKTGVQMGNRVVDGVVVTKDSSGQDALGIREDGTAFMSWLQINTTLTVGDATFAIENINKYPQPYSIYLLTDKFADTTKCENPSYNVVIGDLSADMTANSSVTGVVQQIIESENEIEIPQGKIVLCADNKIASEKMENLKLLKEGDQVTISNTFDGDKRWSECKYIQGSIGGRLIKNGEIQDVDQSASPRSAAGITKDGNLIFYTIDGRQTGHSYGVRLNTLSKRLSELGCVDAINFDGGGSTSIVGAYPGYENTQLLNKPSDGSERGVATFVALVNTREPNGVAAKLHLSPYGGNYLSGTTELFTVSATDENDHPVKPEGEITFSSTGSSYTSTDGTALLTGNGNVTVSATNGEIEGSSTVTVFSNPDEIRFYSRDAKKTVSSLSLSGGETANLKAYAMVESKILTASPSCFTWGCDSAIGSVTQDGLFTASQVSGTGNITVRAGNTVGVIPVTVTGDKYAAYTQAEFSSDSENVYVNLVSKDGINVEKQDISVSADGEIVPYEYVGNTVTIRRNSENSTKIIIAYTNSKGMRSVKSYTADGAQLKGVFADTVGHWSENVVSYMHSKGIVNGVPLNDGTYAYNPDLNMTRYEFAVMTANYMGIAAEDFENTVLSFDDAQAIPEWALNKVKLLVNTGIMNGKTNPDGTITFSGTDNITRAEAVTVLARVFGESLDTMEMNYSDFNDVPDWATDGFKTMISMNVMSGYEDGTLKPHKKITRAEAVKLMYGIY